MRLGHVTAAEAERLPDLVRGARGSIDAETAKRAISAILRDDAA